MLIVWLDEEFRDGIDRAQALEVIDNGRDFDMDEPSKRNNKRTMYVGWNHKGDLLEVGVEWLSESHIRVFHAMPATRKYRQLFGAE